MKKKKRKTNLRMTEPLHFVIYFFLKLDSSYNATPFSLLLNRTETHTHTRRQDAVALCTEKTLFGTMLAPNNNRPTESASVPVPQTRTKHDKSQLRAFKRNNRTSLPRVHLDGETLCKELFILCDRGHRRARDVAVFLSSALCTKPLGCTTGLLFPPT